MTEITAEVARKVLESARQTKMKECQAELNAVLEKHGCKMAIQLGIVDGRIVGSAVLVEDNTNRT